MDKICALPLTLKEVEKRSDESPKGLWVFAAPLSYIEGGSFYLLEDSEVEGVLYDSGWKAVCRVKYSDLGLNISDVIP